MSNAKSGTLVAFIYVTTLFFAWGFVTSTIDPLVASVRDVFKLSFAEAMLTQFAWFIAYGVASLPAAAILSKLGYPSAIIAALTTMVAGCLIIPLATSMDFYPGILLGLFVIACGVTLLQVAANPLSAALGSPERSHFRLTLSQTFNSFGTFIGPFIGASIMLHGGVFNGAAPDAAARAQSLHSIDVNFLMVGAFFFAVALFIWSARKRIDAAAPPHEKAASPFLAFKSGWAVFGAFAIFVYVGSEVAIGSLMTNFLHQKNILDIPLLEAGRMVSLYWMGAMIGRFLGSLAFFVKTPAGVLLSIAAIIAAGMCLTVSQSQGVVAAYVALSIGFFNSIMFPAIFTLTLERSTAPTSATSGLLCMAIIGGAALPFIAGKIVDSAGVFGPAFFVPMLGYIGVAAFAISAARTKPVVGADAPVAAAAGH